MTKTLYCYISHLVTDRTVKNFFDIKNSIGNNSKIIYIIPTGTVDHINDFLCGEEYLFLNLDPKKLIDKINYNCIHNHIIYNKILNVYPDYDYYWLIEYDITINNLNKVQGYKNLFNFYKEDNSDLICSHIHKWSDNEYYQKRYNEYLLNKYKQKKNNFLYIDKKVQTDKLLFGFLSICRISNRLFNNFKEYYKYNTGFFEFTMPSIALYNDYKIRSFNDDGFVYEAPIRNNSEHTINKGSNGWNNRKYEEYYNRYKKNMIIHPIKRKYLTDDDIKIWVCCLSNDKFYLKKFLNYNFINQNNPTNGQLKRKNIFYLNKFFSEYTLQYYVWQNNLKSDYIAFCHEHKIIKSGIIQKDKIASDNFQMFSILYNDWASETTEEANNFLVHAMKYKQGWDDVIEYLKQQKFISYEKAISNEDKNFLQYESFCCKWDDFVRYSEFMWGYIEFIMNKYNLDLTFESWRDHIKENYIDKLDLNSVVWFMFMGYDVYRRDINESLKPYIRCNVWRIYSYILEILSMIYVRCTGYFQYKNKNGIYNSFWFNYKDFID